MDHQICFNEEDDDDDVPPSVSAYQEDEETVVLSKVSTAAALMDGKLREDDGLLRFKLKVENSIEYKGESRVCDESPESETRVCKVCKKSFSSGRALGGHMRIHKQQIEDDYVLNKKNKSQNHKLKKKFNNQQPKLSIPINNVVHNATDDSNGKRNPNENNNTSCSECGKTFPSMKSLFGHMRSHPERQWRGIHPPHSLKKSCLSTISDSIIIEHKVDDRIDSTTTTERSASDLVQSLPSWSVTAKRGRRSIASLNSDERMPDAVYDLLMLAQGGSLESGLSNKPRSDESSEGTHKALVPKMANIEGRENYSYQSKQQQQQRRSEESEAGNIGFISKKLKIDEKGSLRKRRNNELETEHRNFVKPGEGNGISRIGFNQTENMMDSGCVYSDGSGEEDSKQNRRESNPDYFTAGALVSEIIKRKKKKKKVKLRDLEIAQNMGCVTVMDSKHSSHTTKTMSSDRYKCTSCNKSFPSHQALGGHKSSHNKGKNILLTNNDMEEEFALAGAVEEQFEVATTTTTTIVAQVGDFTEFDEMGSKVVGTHRCQICEKTFPTGQALGGHMRRHWNGPVEAYPSCSVVLQEEVGQSRRPLLDFDLNEMPAMEEEEEEEGPEIASTNQSMGIK